MIVGCYSLDLYCARDKISNGPEAGTATHPYDYFPHQYTGTNERDCRAQARKRGWRFYGGEAYCPLCERGKRNSPCA